MVGESPPCSACVRATGGAGPVGQVGEVAEAGALAVEDARRVALPSVTAAPSVAIVIGYAAIARESERGP